MDEEITRSAEWVHSLTGERNHRREVDVGTGDDARKPSDGDDDLLPQLDSSGADTLPSTATLRLIKDSLSILSFQSGIQSSKVWNAKQFKDGRAAVYVLVASKSGLPR